MKHDLPKYTVTGNVNSRGTKYRVTEIIEAQDEKTANSIFKERAKKNLGGVRNVTKVTVNVFKEGDIASKEEIVEKLPVSEPQKSDTEAIDEVLSVLDRIKSNMPKIQREVLKRVVKSDTLTLLKINLRDKVTKKSILTAYRFVLVSKLNKLTEERFSNSDFYSLSERDQATVLFEDIIKEEMSFVFTVYNGQEHELGVMELDYRDECFSNKEISNIINTLQGEDANTVLAVNNVLIEVLKDEGVDTDSINIILERGNLND